MIRRFMLDLIVAHLVVIKLALYIALIAHCWRVGGKWGEATGKWINRLRSEADKEYERDKQVDGHA